MDEPAKMIEMCIQARNVLSLAKKTFGSTLIGAFRCFNKLVEGIEWSYLGLFFIEPEKNSNIPGFLGWDSFFGGGCFW